MTVPKRRGRRARLHVLLALVLLLCGAPAATSAPPPHGHGPFRAQLVYRTGKSLAPMAITIESSTDDDYGMWYGIELVRRNDRWTNRAHGFGMYMELAPAAYPTVYGKPEVTPLPRCPDMPGCTSPLPFGDGRRFHVTPEATSRFYVVSTLAEVKITVSGEGWRVKDVPSPGVRRVFGHDAADGVRSSAMVVEHFTSASAPGGRYGSAAFGYVPCERGGRGEAVLTGRGAETGDGIPPSKLRCYPVSGFNYEYAFTTSPTTWRVTGDVVGVGSAIARLFVFDFPKP